MVTDDRVKVGIWQQLTGSTWARVGDVTGWSSLTVEPQHLQAGPWTLQLPYDAQTAKISKQHLLTFDFRGERFTGTVEHVGPQSDDNTGVVLELSGVDALTLLGDATCWPVPSAGLDGQDTARWDLTADAETACRALIVANMPRLYDIAVPLSRGRGKTVTFSLRFHNLLNQVLSKCAYAGIGVRVGLNQVADSSTRATLACWFYEPQDRSLRVRLTQEIGTLASWSQSDDAPTATRAIVGGGGTGTQRVFRQVTESAVEADWGRKRETFVDARDTTDATVLDQRANEELVNDAAQASFELEATEAAGMRYGDHFTVGDKVTIELLTGVTHVDTLSAAVVTDDSNGTVISLKPGSLDSSHPMFTQAAIVRGLRAQLRALQQED